jgi:translation initiation factor IF-3
VRLVSEDNSHQIVSLEQAWKLAAQEQKDLLLVAERADPPVCRLAYLEKVTLEQAQRRKDAKLKQLTIRRRDVVKEVRS